MHHRHRDHGGHWPHSTHSSILHAACPTSSHHPPPTGACATPVAALVYLTSHRTHVRGALGRAAAGTQRYQNCGRRTQDSAQIFHTNCNSNLQHTSSGDSKDHQGRTTDEHPPLSLFPFMLSSRALRSFSPYPLTFTAASGVQTGTGCSPWRAACDGLDPSSLMSLAPASLSLYSF